MQLYSETNELLLLLEFKDIGSFYEAKVNSVTEYISEEL